MITKGVARYISEVVARNKRFFVWGLGLIVVVGLLQACGPKTKPVQVSYRSIAATTVEGFEQFMTLNRNSSKAQVVKALGKPTATTIKNDTIALHYGAMDSVSRQYPISIEAPLVGKDDFKRIYSVSVRCGKGGGCGWVKDYVLKKKGLVEPKLGLLGMSQTKVFEYMGPPEYGSGARYQYRRMNLGIELECSSNTPSGSCTSIKVHYGASKVLEVSVVE